MSDWKGPKPCKRCGGVKPPGRGARYCSNECKDLASGDWISNSAEYGRRKKTERDRKAGVQPRKYGKTDDKGRKSCIACEEFLDPSQFPKRKKGETWTCKPCTKLYHTKRRLEKEYGITLEDYAELQRLQGGGCYICRKKPRKKMLAVDHDHKTGLVRGLLCMMCNHKLLGAANDDVERLKRAIEYLENPPAKRLGLGRVVDPRQRKRETYS